MVRVLAIHGVWHQAVEPNTVLEMWIANVQAGISNLGHDPPPKTAFVPGFYGDILPETDPIAGFLARKSLTSSSPLDTEPTTQVPFSFATNPPPTIGSIAQEIDQRTRIGKLISTYLFDSVARYLTFGSERDAIVNRFVNQIQAANDTLVIAAHSLGSVVAYDLLRSSTTAQDSVIGLLTFGSPLWLTSVREHLAEHFGDTAFPETLPRWINVYDPNDPVAGDIPLAGFYPSPDARIVEDHRLPFIPVQGFGARDPHAPYAYAASAPFATALHSLLSPAETYDGE